MSLTLTESEIETLMQAAGAAPSGGNMQAWRVTVRGPTIEIALDDARSTSFIDVDRAGSIIGVGSFLENLEVAAAALGLRGESEVVGSGAPDEPLVRWTLADRGTPGSRARLDAIPQRATNRRAWDGTSVEDASIAAIAESVASVGPGYRLAAVGAADDKRAIATALAEGDVVRTFNRRYHEQMLSELRWTEEEIARADGIDVATLELAPGDRKGLSMMRKPWFVSLLVSRARIRRMTIDGLMASSHLGCITAPRSATVEELVRAGRAIERGWLTVTELGLALQPWCVAPVFLLRAERHPDTLPDKDVAAILEMTRALETGFGLDAERERPIFTFRLSRAEPPTARALRLDWRTFTTVAS